VLVTPTTVGADKPSRNILWSGTHQGNRKANVGYTEGARRSSVKPRDQSDSPRGKRNFFFIHEAMDVPESSASPCIRKTIERHRCGSRWARGTTEGDLSPTPNYFSSFRTAVIGMIEIEKKKRETIGRSFCVRLGSLRAQLVQWGSDLLGTTRYDMPVYRCTTGTASCASSPTPVGPLDPLTI
jgi:hypothetical protein